MDEPTDKTPRAHPEKNNRRLVVWLVSLAGGMLLLSYASVPLYRIFCQVTGYGGTPSRTASISAQEVLPAESLPALTVRFNADIARDLAWDFAPEERSMSVQVGEPYMAWYTAKNRSDKGVVGQATFNVTPAKVGKYFHKVQCFCFNEQPLRAGESARMDVQFFIDPQLLSDPDTKEVRTITLSYTFHYYEDLEAEDTHDHDHATLDEGGEGAESHTAVRE